jgi:hypothetical protein
LIEASRLVHRLNSRVADFCYALLKDEITYVSVGLIEGKSLYSAFTHRKWQEVYVNFSLHHHDPSFNAAIKIPDMPIFWDMVPKNTKKAAVIMKERCEMVDITSGITMGFKKDASLLLLTIGSKLQNSDFLVAFNESIIPQLKIGDIL